MPSTSRTGFSEPHDGDAAGPRVTAWRQSRRPDRHPGLLIARAPARSSPSTTEPGVGGGARGRWGEALGGPGWALVAFSLQEFLCGWRCPEQTCSLWPLVPPKWGFSFAAMWLLVFTRSPARVGSPAQVMPSTWTSPASRSFQKAGGSRTHLPTWLPRHRPPTPLPLLTQLCHGTHLGS
ncbi:hypothetical protein J1605_010026 [Eschrichtius robustus]|uniref:Uncharacterized protein n=1 Tax=Eschrichtius robustus TaxID=9764 RepID=A0AB34GTM6_ESCRO|nr:hypothetical protein J1605_010026 [Eschrichtius robustus]